MPEPQNRPLTAPALRLALIAGARRVIAARDGLNRINVFPVADGDTGNNLASTLGSVLNGALSQPSQHAGDLLSRVGNDAIDGARGNSGAILAQFLYGVAERVRTLPELDSASKLIKTTLDDFLSGSTPAARQLFVETLFTVLGAANTHTLGEMADNWTGAAGALWGAARTVDPATRKAVYSVVSTLASSSVDSFMKRLGADREEPPKT